MIAPNVPFEETCAQLFNTFFKKHPNDELRKRTALALLAVIKRQKSFPGKHEGWAAGIVFAIARRGCGGVGLHQLDLAGKRSRLGHAGPQFLREPSPCAAAPGLAVLCTHVVTDEQQMIEPLAKAQPNGRLAANAILQARLPPQPILAARVGDRGGAIVHDRDTRENRRHGPKRAIPGRFGASTCSESLSHYYRQAA